jgi:hypothetical protein
VEEKMLPDDLIPFLVRAKTHTYAAGAVPVHSSRPGSHDLHYEEPPYLYIDTYLGGFAFIGEEAVWKNGVPLWGMNYYGRMLVAEIPAGFGEFLKHSLMLVPLEAPYRGPRHFAEDDYEYRCDWSGSPECYIGEEYIYFKGQPIYQLSFHGGEVRD